MKTVIVYGSTLGNSKLTAERIAFTLGNAELFEVNRFPFGSLPEADLYIFGGSTWGLGELQDDWGVKIDDLQSAALTGKKVALFGTGDQNSYSDTFCDAVGTLYDAAISAGATVIGPWERSGYDFSESKAVRFGRFVGLIIDEENQYDLSSERIAAWCTQILEEMN